MQSANNNKKNILKFKLEMVKKRNSWSENIYSFAWLHLLYYCQCNFCIFLYVLVGFVLLLAVFGYKIQFFTRNFNYYLLLLFFSLISSSYHPHVLSRVFHHATHADKAWPCVCFISNTLILHLFGSPSFFIARTNFEKSQTHVHLS